ncbi:Peptidyl-prolyl cis-trans isomerase (rotamase)-cyclophilin family [Flavobacterium gillisiae]|uniref:peptidylprolyl isomerase n=1 Tax=Flavobacterium gillisiae TaxID=150146 RepID=A0A1H3Y057_9FLAO|nr:peptidylprolyl isomerase [Flavobacterium gillisiae]SEA04234.1 Peptidyl-prolyl cis-trans isomerase (rotamase)-cyclophilin family [Flavobacterium gillisiae]
MKLKLLFLMCIGMLSAQAQTTKKPVPTKKPVSAVKAVVKAPVVEGIFATISTTKGDITTQLEFEKTPVTVANFISLVEGKNTFVTDDKLKGKPFYDGLKFHRVIKDFMIQGGDPTGSGGGTAGYAFKDEFTDLKFDKSGILAMANSGPATNSTQFFITHKDTPWLNGKHTIFGHVTEGMNIVNAIAQGDVITKVTITRKGALAKKFDAPKVFSDYFLNKTEDAKKQALIDAENKAKQVAAEAESKAKQAAVEAESKKVYMEKYAPVIASKKAYFATVKATATTTASGLTYKIVQKGTDVKPIDGSTFYFHYAGYFEDGSLFDSSYEDVNKSYGKYDHYRAAQNGYQAFPFQAGKKDGMIPGFLEVLSLMSYGDKVMAFIPAKLAYGEQGAGDVIPPNATLIFELEMFEKPTTAK